MPSNPFETPHDVTCVTGSLSNTDRLLEAVYDPRLRANVLGELQHALLDAGDAPDGDPDSLPHVLRRIIHEAEMNAYRNKMIDMVVHDLRSPLSAIITGLTIALEEADALPSGTRQEMLTASLNASLTSARLLLEVVEEMLDIETLELGEVPLTLETVSLGKLARQAAQQLDNTATKANVTIDVSVPVDLKPVPVDVGKIRRVFVNLLDNALRYTPSGGEVGVIITAEADRQTVRVVDSGEGLPEEQREQFFQGAAQGAGLGPTYCQLAVEAHGGRIWVEAGRQSGAVFCFSLPTTEAQ